MYRLAASLPGRDLTLERSAHDRTIDQAAGHSRLGADVFAGISSLPNLNQILAEKSEELIVRFGVGDWALAGGILRPDGWPSFGSPSAVAYRALHDLIATHEGFTYLDDAGVQWSALVTVNPKGNRVPWRGVALGLDFPVKLLERQPRFKHLRALSTRLQELIRPGRAIDLDSQRKRARISAFLRRIQLLDAAVNTVPLLYSAVKAQRDYKVCVDSRRLATAAWGLEPKWPTNWHDTVFEAVAMLGTLRTQSLSLPKTGWDPEMDHRRTAVSHIGWQNSQFLTVHLGSEFIKFVAHWLAPRTNRHGRHLESQSTLRN